jgi:uncharacterized protein (TIGR03437 family)
MRFHVSCALIASLAATVAVAASTPTVVHYIDIGDQGKSQLLAADSSGNLFVISQVIEASGHPAIRATKTDPQGNTLASLDFAGGPALMPDTPAGAAVDSQGNLVIVGTTVSANFPAAGLSGPSKTFVVKIDSALETVLLTKVIQGSSTAGAVGLDASGDIYIAGSTGDASFPVTTGAFQTQPPPQSPSGSSAAFLMELSADGSQIVFSTLYGGTKIVCPGVGTCVETGAPNTTATSLEIVPSGAILLAGNTNTVDLPVTPGTYGQQCNCTNVNVGFVASFSPNGSKLNWATYLPTLQSLSSISVSSIAIAPDGSVVVVGAAQAAALPVTSGALEPANPGPANELPSAGFVSKFDPLGQHLLFSTYLGGEVPDPLHLPTAVSAVAVDAQGTIWVTGGSDPTLLPVASGTPLLGPEFTIGLSSGGATIEAAFTAPAGATGQALLITAQGTIMTLGTAGSILPFAQNQTPALFGIANSGASHVSGIAAPYELVSFYGLGLGPAVPLNMQVVSQGLFQYASTSLGGVQVLFDGVAAPLVYVGPSQINAIVPNAVANENTTTVQIVTPNGTISGPSLFVRPSHPEVFRVLQGSLGFLEALALNQDGTVNSAANPAAPGSIVAIFASGGGGLSFGDGEITSTVPASLSSYRIGGALALPVSVVNNSTSTLGSGSMSESLEVLYAGQAPGEIAGVIQINFQLLAGQIAGQNSTNLQVQIGDAISEPFTLYIGNSQ